MDGLFNRYLFEMPAILDSLFHKVVNTTNSSIGVEGGGGRKPRSWRDFPIQENLYGQMTSIQAVFGSTYRKMKLGRCPASLVVITCQLSAWPGKVEPFTDHPGTGGQQTGS